MSQEISSQSINGINFSARGRVLVRAEKAALIWFAGGPYYANMMEGTKYGESSLHIVRNSTNCATAYSTLHRGGRLTPKLLEGLKEKIDAEFGAGTTANLNVKHTWVTTPSKPWFRIIPESTLQQERFERERRRQEKLEAEARRARQRKLPRRETFTLTEIEAIAVRFMMANDEEGREVHRKAEIIAQWMRPENS